MSVDVIQIKNLTKKFKNVTALNNVSFSIKKGEIFGFLGPSGSGKTTTVKILTGQLSPTSGSVSILNNKIDKSGYNLYKYIGIMTDNSGLYDRLTTIDNLTIFAKIHGIEKEYAIELLKLVELYDARKTLVNKLSKGMKQRLLLARALVNRPKILFLDEPTSDLDPTTTLKIHNILLKLRDEGTTIFITTHNMVEATKLCDNVALLYKGNIVEYGSPKKISMDNISKRTYSITTKNGYTLDIDDNLEGVNHIIKLFEENNIASIHSNEPTLEDVFIKITGRSLL